MTGVSRGEEDGRKGSTGSEVEALGDFVKRVRSCPLQTLSLKSREVSASRSHKDERSREKCDCSSISEGAVRRTGCLFIRAPCFGLIPRPSRWMARFSFVHQPLPEKWSLPPSLDTVRSSEEEELFEAAWEGVSF